MPEAILEIKTMNDALFAQLVKRGVKYSHPHYYAQLQFLMGLSGLKQAVLVAYNKNTSAYEVQIVDADVVEQAYLTHHAEKALYNQSRKIAPDALDWRCKDCFKRTACWGATLTPKDKRACHLCQYAQAIPDGSWVCTQTGDIATMPCRHFKIYHPKPRED
jgi:hypothetical protein